MVPNGLGRHLIVEVWGVDPALLDDEARLREVLIEAAKRAGGRVIGVLFHKFKPQGVTGVVAIAESHISVHTWPEYGYAAIDIFTCGSHVDPWKAFEHSVDALKPKSVSVFEVKRGILPEGEKV
ncbi:MAG TPA: adenosylmethionine decarboxylase [Candidatus Bathyarchaeota archaeon]|nr:adenosylmethionine decarboxylase [Candidatus Bathyarchaeota archaeon]